MSSDSFEPMNCDDGLNQVQARASDTTPSSSVVNLQQPAIVRRNQMDHISDCRVMNMQGLEKISQLTGAVSNLLPLLESFKQEQIQKEKQLVQLTEENKMLQAKIRNPECLDHLDPPNDLFAENKSLESKLQSTQSLLQQETAKLQEVCRHNDSLKKQLFESKSTENSLISENKRFMNDLDEKAELLRKNESTYNNLYTEYSNLEFRLKDLEKERDDLKKCRDLYQTKLKNKVIKEKRLQEENECLTSQRDEYKKMTENLKSEKRKLEDEVKETKKRLSQVMGTKLSADNPDIADLSDQNRPTKLAEKYAELYDNEWTDAFEAVQELTNEKQAIKTLLRLLQDIQTFCNNLANTQTENIRTAVMMTFNQDKSPSEYFSTQLRIFRRATSVEAIGGVIEKYMEYLQMKDSSRYTTVNEIKMKPFVHKCLEICWLMAAQTPPVVFAKLSDHETPGIFDSSTYKPYTKTGAFVDFIVWPPLYLHEHGPLLAKGVAQGCRELSSKNVKLKKGAQASSVPGTAVPIPRTTNNSLDMTRSFNVKSTRNKMVDFSTTVSGASGFYDNNLSSIPPEHNDQPYD